MNNIVKNNKGATAIFITLAVLSAMLFVAIAANSIIQNGIRMGRAHINSTKAYYGAEAGVERILWEIRKNGHDPVADVWGNGDCVNYANTPVGDIAVAPTAGCGIGNTSQTLVNNKVKYHIEYIEDLVSNAPDTTVRLKSVGNYQDITRRAVEVTYID